VKGVINGVIVGNTNMEDLGLFKDYGHIILSAFMILYGMLHSYLAKEYESLDEDELQEMD